MTTQREMIKKSKHAYIIYLNDIGTRFQIYVDHDNGMSVLWPSGNHESKPKDLLPYQVYSRREHVPPYYFHLPGYGYSKTYMLKEMLKKINPKIEVRILSGGFPATC